MHEFTSHNSTLLGTPDGSWEFKHNKLQADWHNNVTDLPVLQTSSISDRGGSEQGYLHIVMDTLQKHFTVVGDNFPLLGGPQGAN